MHLDARAASSGRSHRTNAAAMIIEPTNSTTTSSVQRPIRRKHDAPSPNSALARTRTRSAPSAELGRSGGSILPPTNIERSGAGRAARGQRAIGRGSRGRPSSTNVIHIASSATGLGVLVTDLRIKDHRKDVEAELQRRDPICRRVAGDRPLLGGALLFHLRQRHPRQQLVGNFYKNRE